jgi:hypothetical protein
LCSSCQKKYISNYCGFDLCYFNSKLQKMAYNIRRKISVFFYLYRVINPHKFWMCLSLTTLDKLVDKFSLPPVAPLIGSVIDDTNLTHVMRLAAYSSTLPTPTAMGQSFIMTLYYNTLLQQSSVNLSYIFCTLVTNSTKLLLPCLGYDAG